MNLTPQFKKTSSTLALAITLQFSITAVNADQNLQFRPLVNGNAPAPQVQANPTSVPVQQAAPQRQQRAQYRGNNGYARPQNNGFMNGNNMPFSGGFNSNRGNGMPFSGGFMNNNGRNNWMPFSGGFMNNNGRNNGMPFSGGFMNNNGRNNGMPFSGGFMNNNGRNNGMPFFGRGNNMPFFNNNRRNNRFMNGDWIDMSDPKGTAERGFDEALDAPSQMGEMPGGWTAPSISVPNPVEVGDQFRKAAEDLPDQMRNMNN